MRHRHDPGIGDGAGIEEEKMPRRNEAVSVENLLPS
jgi:hypothetical protein